LESFFSGLEIDVREAAVLRNVGAGGIGSTERREPATD
jgi:ABC-type phosphate/phosphonate transport system permease subunit